MSKEKPDLAPPRSAIHPAMFIHKFFKNNACTRLPPKTIKKIYKKNIKIMVKFIKTQYFFMRDNQWKTEND